MPITGALILIFLVIHIQGIKFGADYRVVYGGIEMRDLHKLCVEYFSNGGMVVYYVFTMIALGIHLSHGVWSAFQSLGFSHPKYSGPLRFLSTAFGAIICIGFSALPIVLYLKGGA
jgi:succinate dehydrogenase / fumarate reductase cytochrome b subunit